VDNAVNHDDQFIDQQSDDFDTFSLHG